MEVNFLSCSNELKVEKDELAYIYIKIHLLSPYACRISNSFSEHANTHAYVKYFWLKQDLLNTDENAKYCSNDTNELCSI